MQKTYWLTALLWLGCLFSGFAQGKENWVKLFNGKDLTGWKQLGGNARYEVKDGMIVGTSTLNTPNSFLTTEKNYGDFILECEVFVDDRLNSGIQIRSLSKPDYQNGRVHGYQVEIDPSPRGWSAGIYDEARRGWLYPVDINPDAKTAFKNGQWNKYRIEAVGNTIQTFLNGVAVAHLIDDMTPNGFICLQVHSINKPDQNGTQVKWRNIRIQTTNPKLSPAAPIRVVNLLPNHLSEPEKAQGWKLLFDGTSADQWRGHGVEGFPSQRWQAQNGELSVLKSDGSAKGNDLITKQKFGRAFEFQFEFKLTEGANSGVKYFVNEAPGSKSLSGLGLEYQVLDDAKHPDAKMGAAGNRTLASLYDLIPSEKPGNSLKKIGEWNRGRLVVYPNGKVEHYLNEQLVLEYKRGGAIYRALVARSKYKDIEGFGLANEGHLLLQDHSDFVSFRSLKVKELQ